MALILQGPLGLRRTISITRRIPRLSPTSMLIEIGHAEPEVMKAVVRAHENTRESTARSLALVDWRSGSSRFTQQSTQNCQRGVRALPLIQA